MPAQVYVATSLPTKSGADDAYGFNLDGVDGPPICTAARESMEEGADGLDNRFAPGLDLYLDGGVTLALGVENEGSTTLITLYSVQWDGSDAKVLARALDGSLDRPIAAARAASAALDGKTQIFLDGPVRVRATNEEEAPLLEIQSPRLTLRPLGESYEVTLGGVVDVNDEAMQSVDFMCSFARRSVDLNRASPEVPGGPCDGISIGFRLGSLVPAALGEIITVNPMFENACD